ncbi:MAG: AI-2E family transporter, partial [Candidatus Kapaibacteriota bacterium]
MDRPAINIALPLLILSAVALGAVLYVLHSILIPLVLAGFLAIIFKPLVGVVRRLGAPTWVGL